jgi:hypothetical protein
VDGVAMFGLVAQKTQQSMFDGQGRGFQHSNQKLIIHFMNK